MIDGTALSTPTGGRRASAPSGRASLVFYIARRLVGMAIMLVVVSFLVFSLIYLAPGSPIDALLGAKPRTPETVAALTKEFNLDKPFLEQYFLWAWNALHGDFGRSIQSSLPVSEQIMARVPVSVTLGLLAFGMTMVAGIVLGVRAAIKKGRATDRVTTAGVIVALSTPTFVAAILLLYVFAIQLRWFPPYGKGSGGLDTLWHLVLPAIALALGSCAYVVKHTRAAMIGVLDQDYITFARARGVAANAMLFRYSLRNALLPVITISGVVLAGLIVGAVLVEVTFSIQGIGQMLVQAATKQDIPMIQGVTVLIAALIIGLNLLADVIYMVVDPRIRLGGR